MIKELDYIIVGCGLAGIAFCEQLKAKNKTFVVFDNSSQTSSLVAAGMYNPIILKRFSAVWKAKTQLDIVSPFYTSIENELNTQLDHKLRLLRRFASIEEQNIWFTAADRPNIKDYLSLELVKNTNSFINAPFGFGEVQQAGRVDTYKLITAYKERLRQSHLLYEDTFKYNEIIFENSNIAYQNFKAKHVVFAEGFGVSKNPFFKYLPINGTKGEVLTLFIPKLDINYAIKSSIFLIPLGNNLYNVGATYNWKDKTNTPTQIAKTELLTKLKLFLNTNFEVVDHSAGIRPTVKDRRPVLGSHPRIKHLYVLNGLGTRGVMIAPYVAKKLYNYIEHQTPLDAEINCSRFS